MRLRYERLLQWEQNRSKAMMWQLYEFQLFEGAKKFLVDSRLCVACYYPTTTTDYPSTTRGMSVGPPVAVDIDICGYLWFFIITFAWIMWVHHWQPFWSTTRVRFIGQCWNFNPQWTSEQAIIKARSVSQLRKMRSQEVSTYISVFVKGLRRCRGYILAPEWKPDLQGSCHIASHST